ncbi:hypothetical protein Y1Q_0022895 [Alligator mississippiensis]|uniref:Uncharacterized protein n=1 Tax=Alligator mississippiensis TaxID=8496 RepID=A0A151N4T1_ALLMI|nr:hypothetical protein Y1Q_0022895 [Alligator mississippiensis]
MEERKVARPRVTFFQPRGSPVIAVFSVFAGSEAAARRFLPKSRISTVIIRDNASAQRLQDLEAKHLEQRSRKTSHFHEHLRKKFVDEQQRKTSRWRREADKFGRLLELVGQRTRNLASAASASLALRSSQARSRDLSPKKDAAVMSEK